MHLGPILSSRSIGQGPIKVEKIDRLGTVMFHDLDKGWGDYWVKPGHGF